MPTSPQRAAARAPHAVLAAGIALVAALGIPAGAVISSAPATAAPTVQEDESRWDCIFDGNRICGPLNAQGATPGCYNDHAALVAPWPCHVVVNADGSSDVYAGPAPVVAR